MHFHDPHGFCHRLFGCHHRLLRFVLAFCTFCLQPLRQARAQRGQQSFRPPLPSCYLRFQFIGSLQRLLGFGVLAFTRELSRFFALRLRLGQAQKISLFCLQRFGFLEGLSRLLIVLLLHELCDLALRLGEPGGEVRFGNRWSRGLFCLKIFCLFQDAPSLVITLLAH